MLAAGAAAILAAPREPAGSDNSVHPAAATSVQSAQELRLTSHNPRAAAHAHAGVGDDDKTDAAIANDAPPAVLTTVSAPPAAHLAPPAVPAVLAAGEPTLARDAPREGARAHDNGKAADEAPGTRAEAEGDAATLAAVTSTKAAAHKGKALAAPLTKPETPDLHTMQYEAGAFAAGLTNSAKHIAGSTITNDHLTSGARGNNSGSDGSDQAAAPTALDLRNSLANARSTDALGFDSAKT